MVTERYQKYLDLLTKHLSSDMNGYVLAEKQAEVIVTLGDLLEAAKIELEAVKEELSTVKAKAIASKTKCKCKGKCKSAKSPKAKS